MDEFLKGLCAEHNLSSASVMIMVGHTPPFTVYLHPIPDGCASGNGYTIEQATECALVEMREMAAATAHPDEAA